MNENVYTIIDLDGYADAVRTEAAASHINNHNDNLDDFITLEQTKNLVVSHSLGVDDSDNNIIDTDTHYEIIEDIAGWIFNVGLAKLAAANKLECAWDNSINDMIFWLPDNHTSNTDNTHDIKSNNTTQTRDRQD